MFTLKNLNIFWPMIFVRAMSWAALVLLGFLCNLFPVNLYWGVPILFGEVFIIFLAVRFTLAATVVGTLIITIPLYLHLGHLWDSLIYIAEAIFLWSFSNFDLGRIKFKDHIIIAVIAYWCTLGWFSVLLVNKLFLQIPTLAVEILALKYVINSILAVLIYIIYDAFFRYNKSQKNSIYSRYLKHPNESEFSWDISELVSLAFLYAVIVPLLLSQAFSNRSQVEAKFLSQDELLESMALFMRQRIEGWISASDLEPFDINTRSSSLEWLEGSKGQLHFSQLGGGGENLVLDAETAQDLLRPLREQILNDNPTDSFDLSILTDSNYVIFSTITQPQTLRYMKRALGRVDPRTYEILSTINSNGSIPEFFQLEHFAKTIEVPALGDLRFIISMPTGVVLNRVYVEYRRTMVFTLALAFLTVLLSRFLMSYLVGPLARITQTFAKIDIVHPLESLDVIWPKSGLTEYQEFTTKLQSLLEVIKHAALERDRIAKELSTLIRHANCPIIGLDVFGKINSWNDQASLLTGYNWEEIKNKSLVDSLVTPDAQERVARFIDCAFSGDSVFNKEVTLLKKNEEHFELLMNISCRENAMGQVIGLICMGQDLTALKNAQAQLFQSAKLSSLGEMASSVAHELNQPLNVIRMAAANCIHRLENGLADNDFVLAKLERISSQTQRAAAIIDHMRMFARKPETGQTLIDSSAVIKSVLELMGEQLRLQQIDVLLDLPQDCMPVLGNAILLEQVILNLLENAMYVMLEKPRVDAAIGISLHCHLAELHIRVEDNAGGIAEKILPRIFDPFFTTKPVGKGTGLGLSISSKIIQDMGGSIHAENSATGAVFVIILPVVLQPPPDSKDQELGIDG